MLAPRLLFAAIIGFAGWQYVHYDPVLPDIMATHFGGSGTPNGWQSKAGFWQFSFALVVGAWLLLAAVAWITRIIPSSLINVPNRAFWLAEDRCEATRRRLRLALEWYGSLQAAWMLWLLHSLIRINLDPDPRLGSEFIWQMLAVLGFTVVWLVWLLRSFRLPAAGQMPT